MMQTLNAARKTKKTTAGRIPMDWEAINLGDYLREISVRNSPLNTNLPVLSVTNTQGFVTSESYFDRKVYSKDLSNYKIVSKDQFAYNPSRINVGSIAQLKNFDQGCLSPMYVVFETQEGLDADYLAYWIQSGRFKNLIDANTQGTVRDSVNFSALAGFPFALPPVHEQKAITSILSCVDEVIVKTQAVIEQTKRLKKALMQELFTRGLPGRHKKFKKTPVGEIPQEWEMKRLKDVTIKIADGVHKKPSYIKEGIPFLTVKNLTAGPGISFDDANCITQADHNEFIKRTNPEKGDILITKDGTLGIPRVIETDRIFSIFVSLALIKPKHEVIDSYFLRYGLEAPVITTQFGLTNTGSALKHIHLIDLRRTYCPLPSLNEQQEIIQVVRFIEDKERQEVQFLSELSNFKSALMQVLLTGEVRVKT